MMRETYSLLVIGGRQVWYGSVRRLPDHRSHAGFVVGGVL